MKRFSSSFRGSFEGRSVWLSGHTGFKGSWLAEWLLRLGARVHGFSQASPTTPALFEQLNLQPRLASHTLGDVCHAQEVGDAMAAAAPDFVFHLAAQSLVRRGYQNPAETWRSNVWGTLQVLETLRGLNRPCTAIFITTDKVYENREWVHGYREEDSLGGYDPYSASKAAAEILIGSHRRSFFSQHPVRIASARAGNVIGGGDWALDRIVPDCIRALQAGQPVDVRNPAATRPWQHVLDPLAGYLLLGSRMDIRTVSDADAAAVCDGFNFGPAVESSRPVRDVVETLIQHLPGSWRNLQSPNAVHEAGLLHLCTDKSRHTLGWRPVWDFQQTIFRTAEWYQEYARTGDALSVVDRQLAVFQQAAV